MTSDNAQRVLAALQRTSSARRLDLMHTCHLTRGGVHEALDELKCAGLVNSIAAGARFVARSSICPPTETHTSTTQLADDTQPPEPRRCGTVLGAVAHIVEGA